MALDIASVAIALVLGALVFALIWSLRLAKDPTFSAKKVNEENQKNGSKGSKKEKQASKKKPASNPPPVKENKTQFSHKWLLTTLKGHTATIQDMDLSPSGKHVATCSEDRSLMLWTVRLDKLEPNVKELNMKDIRTIRSAVKFDHATRIRWSPDSKALLTIRATNNDVEIYRLNKKEGGALPTVTPTGTLPKHREADLMAIEVASTGRFIMTCTPKNEVDLMDLKGQIIHSFTTNQMVTYCAKISPCAKLLAVSGFTPDVKVMEVVYSKTGEFEKVTRAFELSGHTSGIWSFDFSPDSSRMVTVSKDGTWRLYNTNIEYRKGQLATLMTSGKWLNDGDPAHIALSPDGLVIAIGSGTRLSIHSAASGETLAQIDEVHAEPIRAVRIDSSSRFILTTGDRMVRIFHNVPGYKMALNDLESKLRKAGNQTLRERIQQQLNEAQTLVDRFN